jgi:prephenate dehydrogenase
MEVDFSVSSEKSDISLFSQSCLFGGDPQSGNVEAKALSGTSKEPESITVVGGEGKMGRLFVELFRKAGHDTRVADISNGPIDWEKVAKSDIIALAAPMGSLNEIAMELGPLTSPESAVIDLSSLKRETMELLNKHFNAGIIACHPLFGPTVETLEGRLFFICSDEQTQWSPWFSKFLRDHSATVVYKPAEDHDELMAVAQSLRHMMLIAFGLTLKRLGFDPDKDLELSGPWFGQLVDLLRKQMEQPAGLYADIALMNSAFPEVFQVFSQEVWDLFHKITVKDRKGMLNSINGLSEFLGSK